MYLLLFCNIKELKYIFIEKKGHLKDKKTKWMLAGMKTLTCLATEK